MTSRKSKIMVLRSALEAILPFAENGDSPGGCDGQFDDCTHCLAIRAARKALLETAFGDEQT